MYITIADLQAQGITGESSYLASLVSRVEATFNSLIGIDEGVMSQARTEKLENISNATEIFLRYQKPTSLTSINTEAISSGDYTLLWQKLLLKNPVSSLSEFPFLCTIVYVAGYTDIPEDIKQVCLSLASYFQNTKTAGGISNFSQDLLSVTYGAKEIYDYLDSLGQSVIINKYKDYYAYSL